MFSFYTTENTRNFRFLVLQEGIKWEHWLLVTFNISFKFNITNFSILYLMKTQGKQRFSGGSKWEHWPEMSYQKQNVLKF